MHILQVMEGGWGLGTRVGFRVSGAITFNLNTRDIVRVSPSEYILL